MAVLCLAGLAIGISVPLVTKTKTSKSTPSTAASTSPSTTSNAPDPTATSQSLLTCLQTFQSTTPTSPSSYPCSDCVPLFTATSNDYLSPLVNANSTGVGAALQFCALMDVYRAAENGTLGSEWGSNASPCDWQGIICDTRGRVTGM